MSKLFLFDVDGTIAESGQPISDKMRDTIQSLLYQGIHIGIVGGGKLDKVLRQVRGLFFHYYFTECGCVLHKTSMIDSEIYEVYCKNIRDHRLYPFINKLIKECLAFLSNVEYTLTGNFIDLRNGIVYVSLIGMSANEKERKEFIELDKKHLYRSKLIALLQKKSDELCISSEITITEGGSVGIAIYPKECDKVQVLEHLSSYSHIHYFGDKYDENGNDYTIINHPNVIGHRVDNPDETTKQICKLI